MDSTAQMLIEAIVKQEGVYSNVSGDNGGETYVGISRASNAFPNWSGWTTVDSYKSSGWNGKSEIEELKTDVRDFYYDNFYTELKCDSIECLMIKGHLFCHGVNGGATNSVKLLQSAINTVTNAGISVDGIIGSQTIAYCNNASYAPKIASQFIENRNNKYKSIVANNSSQAKFLDGWLNRVKNMTTTCSS